MAPTEEAITALVDHLTGERVPGQAREQDFTPWGSDTNGTARRADLVGSSAHFNVCRQVIGNAGAARVRVTVGCG
jgi:hypothetical protein